MQPQLSNAPTQAQGDCLCMSVTRCNTLQHTAIHCIHCNILLMCSRNFLFFFPRQCKCKVSVYACLQHTATHCNTLQHTATHCNTPQHTAHVQPQLSNTPSAGCVYAPVQAACMCLLLHQCRLRVCACSHSFYICVWMFVHKFFSWILSFHPDFTHVYMWFCIHYTFCMPCIHYTYCTPNTYCMPCIHTVLYTSHILHAVYTSHILSCVHYTYCVHCIHNTHCFVYILSCIYYTYCMPCIHHTYCMQCIHHTYCFVYITHTACIVCTTHTALYTLHILSCIHYTYCMPNYGGRPSISVSVCSCIFFVCMCVHIFTYRGMPSVSVSVCLCIFSHQYFNFSLRFYECTRVVLYILHILQQIATHCNTLQHPAALCNPSPLFLYLYVCANMLS